MIWLGAAAATLGVVVGSFVATAALRSTRREQAMVGRSACDHCRAPLGYAATVPLVSFVQRRGACACCGGKIDLLHPVGEAAAGLGAGLAFMLLPPVQALAVCGLGLILLASSVIDAKTRRLPDGLTLAVALLGLALAGLRGQDAVFAGLIAGVIAFVLLVALRALVAKSGRGEALGFGDVKLICALALWLGPLTPWATVGAAALGLATVLITRPADGRISFGPAIAVAGWIVGLLYQAKLWPDVI